MEQRRSKAAAWLAAAEHEGPITGGTGAPSVAADIGHGQAGGVGMVTVGAGEGEEAGRKKGIRV